MHFLTTTSFVKTAPNTNNFVQCSFLFHEIQYSIADIDMSTIGKFYQHDLNFKLFNGDKNICMFE